MVLKDTSILQGELLFLGFPYNRSDIRHIGHVNNQAQEMRRGGTQVEGPSTQPMVT